jgi:Kef-type K+ transport system membrane component KefB
MIEFLSHLPIWVITAIIFAGVILAKVLSKKTGTVDVLWLILIGSFLGNLHIIPEHSKEIEFLGELGIIFIMFALGLDENLHHFVVGLKKAWGIAIIGALFPFLAGYIGADMFGYNFSSSMVWGLTMTATAVSLTMMTLKSKRMHKSTAATGIMTAAVVDDVLSLVGVAILIPIIIASSGDMATSGADGESMILTTLIILLKVAVFFGIVIFVGLFSFPERRIKADITTKEMATDISKARLLTLFKKLPEYIFQLTGIKKVLLMYKGEFTPLIVIFIAIAMGAIAYLFDFHPAIGAYFAGLFLSDEYFIEVDEANEQVFKQHIDVVKTFMDNLAFIILGPIFFINLGSKLIFDGEILIDSIVPVLTLFGLVFVLQILSAGLAARFTGGYKNHDSILIGLGMLGRAELAFIVINIAYSANNIISTQEFYILVFTTFLLNISVPITINLWEPYYKGKKELKIGNIRLSRETPREEN